MVVHLPDGTQITRYTGEARWDEYRFAFGDKALSFFRWQERTADAMWDLALRLPPWPPQSPADFGAAASAGTPWLLNQKTALLGLAQDAFRPVIARLSDAPESLRLFADAQLLISAQATSERQCTLRRAALDLPRRGGTSHRRMGTIAETLVSRSPQRWTSAIPPRGHPIRTEGGFPVAVETKRGDLPSQPGHCQLYPWDAARLFDGFLPRRCVACPLCPRTAGALLSCMLG
jgi:hypothetical protein